jgi:hypothetical protein
MKKIFLKRMMIFFSGTILLLTSCERTEDEPDITANNLKGMFVVCEGIFGSANGDITYYNPETKQWVKSLYYSVNKVTPGDVVQAFEVLDTLGFLLVNNAQKVVVVNMKDFTKVKTIGGFSYPRSVVRGDEKSVYVSNGNGYSGNYIYKVDLKTLKKTDSLKVTTGPEKLIVAGSKVYASIAGGWKNDGNTVIEIDPLTFRIFNTFKVASVPIDMATDKYNNIWVFCKGVATYDANWNATYSDMGISKINTSTKMVTNYPFTTMKASGLNNIASGRDGSVIYYLNDGLYSMPVTASILPVAKLVDKLFYGVDVDPVFGYILCLDSDNSEAFVYGGSGVEQYHFETAAFPNSVCFSY